MNKTYLIAGGSSGIGLELVKQLVADNNNVIVISRTSDNIPTGVQHYKVDFRDNDPVLPQIDIPIHGLAYFPGSILLKPFKAFRRNDFTDDYALNVIGAVMCTKYYLPQLQKVDNASVVFMSSVAVSTGMPFHSLVAASKGAIEGLTRSLAAELSPSVRVNAIAPSITDTPLAEKFLNSDDKRSSSAERHPVKQIGDPADIASLAYFLLSDKSKFITGQIIHADGGMSSIRKI